VESLPTEIQNGPGGSIDVNPGGAKLTPRERAIVKLLSDGHGNKETARLLGISVKTVETHKMKFMLKLNLHTATDLLHYAISRKILKPEEMLIPQRT
jgi:two-component system nitrate/nitrite response regulator NarL